MHFILEANRLAGSAGRERESTESRGENEAYVNVQVGAHRVAK